MDNKSSMSTPNKSQTTQSRFRDKISKTAVFIVVGMLAGTIGFTIIYQLNHHRTVSIQTTFSYPYNYNRLNLHQLIGKNSGSGISFKKPVEFGSKQGSTTKSDQTQLRQPVVKNGQFVSIGGIAVSSSYMAKPLPAQFLKAIADSMANSDNPNHQSSIENLTRFINSSLGPRYTSKLAVEVKNLKTANIKSNAWIMDFSASPKTAQDKTQLPNLHGQIIFSIGKRAFYHLMVYAEDHNWTNNQKAWIQVLDSIKIDQ